MLDEIGNPHHHFAAIHIGGTNGKGSVAAMVYGALRASGRRVGMYTSPHLVHVAERIIVDQCPIGVDAFATWTSRMHQAIEESGASFFEALTAMAFADFAARGVDIAVVEVGLGGRLDSTNVLLPLVTAVTNVGLDHTDFLGDTLDDIAREKAGIAKAATPFVLGEPQGPVARVLRDVAQQAGAEVIPVPEVAPDDGPGTLRLVGHHQHRNAAIAKEIIDQLPGPFQVDEASRAAGISQAWLPGRLDRRGRWIFDVAHNLSGMTALTRALETLSVKRPFHAVMGVLGDKDAAGMLSTLSNAVDRTWVTFPPSAPPERQSDLASLEQVVAGQIWLQADFDLCLQEAAEQAETVLVTGSFHTVGDAMLRLPGFRPYG